MSRYDNGGWRLTLQKTGEEISKKGFVVALGTLTLIDPNGDELSVPIRSGGHGKYGDKSMLPGLGDEEGASYTISWNNLAINSGELKRAMKGYNGTGYWIGLGDPPYKYRHRHSFGIHTDGPSSKKGGMNDGTHGCIGLEPGDDRAFFNALMRIPRSQRPTHMEVLSPRDSRENQIMAGSNTMEMDEQQYYHGLANIAVNPIMAKIVNRR
jgi:hypothetical protein